MRVKTIKRACLHGWCVTLLITQHKPHGSCSTCPLDAESAAFQTRSTVNFIASGVASTRHLQRSTSCTLLSAMTQSSSVDRMGSGACSVVASSLSENAFTAACTSLGLPVVITCRMLMSATTQKANRGKQLSSASA